MPRVYHVYIITNRPNGVLCTGVTNDLRRRVERHRIGEGSKFAAKHNRRRLTRAQAHANVEEAILREKRIKEWRRAWKTELIEAATRTGAIWLRIRTSSPPPDRHPGERRDLPRSRPAITTIAPRRLRSRLSRE